MASQSSTVLKTYFETGDVPTQTQFAEFIESYSNLVDNNALDLTETGITAHAGGGQASAYALTKLVSVVSTVATTNDSVKFPGALVGRKAFLFNKGANTLAAYPLSGGNFVNIAVDQALLVPVGYCLFVECVSENEYNYTLYTQVGRPVLVADYQTSAATITPDLSVMNNLIYSQLSTNPTIAAPIKHGVFGDRFSMFLKDDGTSRTITWNSTYAFLATPAPTATVAGKWMFFEFIYQSSTGKWYVTTSVVESNNTVPKQVYRAYLTQSSTGAPSATVIENTLGVTPSFSRLSTGNYTITAAGKFVAGKWFMHLQTVAGTVSNITMTVSNNFDDFPDEAYFRAINDSLVVADTWNAFIELYVYP